MGIIQKLFGNRKEKKVSISTVAKDHIPQGAVIYAESEIPEYCLIGNLIFEKKYEEAIALGKKMLAENPYSAGVHVNLMDVYFKSRSENIEYFELSTIHAKQAMICGHNTGYVQNRLVINLEKEKHFHQAVQLCDIIISDKFNFSSHGAGKKSDFKTRKDKLLCKLSQSNDSELDSLFTYDQLLTIYKNIEENNNQEAKQIAKSDEMKKKYEQWFSEEETNKRADELRDAIYGNYKD